MSITLLQTTLIHFLLFLIVTNIARKDLLKSKVLPKFFFLKMYIIKRISEIKVHFFEETKKYLFLENPVFQT